MKTKIGFYLYNKVSMQEFRGLLVKSSMYERWHDIYRLQLSATLQQLIKSASKQDSDYQYKDKTWRKISSYKQWIPSVTEEDWLLEASTPKIIQRMSPTTSNKNHQDYQD